VVNDKDEMRMLAAIGYAVVESPMLRPRAKIFLGSKLTPAGSRQEGAKSTQCRLKVLLVVETGTVTEAFIVAEYTDVEPEPLAMSGSRIFTTTGTVPLFVIVTDMPVKAVPVAGSDALIPPLSQPAFVNGVP